MIVRSAPSPTGNGPVVGDGAVRAGHLRRAGHPVGVHSLPARAADEPARTTHQTQPSPASEDFPSSGSPKAFTPCDDPATAALLEKLVSEREPSLEQLLLERNRIPEFYTAMGALFEDRLYWLMREQNTRGLVGAWDGRLPK